MLSLEQIKTITFEKIMRGYRAEDVDDFIAQIATQIEQLMNDKQDAENKMYILAEKVEEYRSQEDALTAALINAQRLGDSVIKEANQKAEHIIREAKAKTDRDYDIAVERINAEQKNLLRMQAEVSKFRSDVLSIYKQHIESLSSLPVSDKTKKSDIKSKPNQIKPIEIVQPQIFTEMNSLQNDSELMPQEFNNIDKPQNSAFEPSYSSQSINTLRKKPSENIVDSAAPYANEDTKVYEIDALIPKASIVENTIYSDAPAQQSGKISLFEPYTDFTNAFEEEE